MPRRTPGVNGRAPWLAGLVLAVVACAGTSRAPAPPAAVTFPAVFAPMPRFSVERWVNSPPREPAALRGKVVLVDFWEYTCVNCIRTLPYLRAWHGRYAASGLVVIGVHAPEFEFGKRAENIDRGIRDHGLTYPIAIDNDFTTWRAYENHAWPAKYLFDAEGRLRNRWIGEGGYPEIEDKIRQLLGEAGTVALPARTAEVEAFERSAAEPDPALTPETYLGTARRRGSGVARVGAWESRPEYVEHAGDEPARLVLDFAGGEVNLVLAPGRTGVARARVTLDGHEPGSLRGADVAPDGRLRIDRAGMFQLVRGAGAGRHTLALETEDEGLRAFAFTFGP